MNHVCTQAENRRIAGRRSALILQQSGCIKATSIATGYPMALHHALPGEIIEPAIAPSDASQNQSTALLRTDEVEVIRRVLQKDRDVAEHSVDGPIIFHCLAGAVQLVRPGAGTTLLLRAGQMSWLAGGDAYALSAQEDSVLLMTIVRRRA